MDLSSTLDKWFWVLFIIINLVNVAIYHVYSREQIQENPELERGYHDIIRASITWGNLPWIVMGIGCTIGGIPSIFDYFHTGDGDPYVIAFWCSLLLIWILGTHWLFFREGADVIVRHQGPIKYAILDDPSMVKLFWCLGLAGGIASVLIGL